MNALTEEVIGRSYAVANTLGHGFLEKVYENALVHELLKVGLSVRQQEPIDVLYDGIVVGQFIADLYVEDMLIVEIKAVESLNTAHVAQCVNYLKATGNRLALLINFGTPRVQIRRVIHD